MTRMGKRLSAAFIAAIMMVVLIPLMGSMTVYAEELDSGQAGDCMWTYYNNSGKYVLHFNGMSDDDGRVPDYTMVSGESTAPWTKYRNQVDEVSFSNVKEVGDYAFRDFTKISMVYIEGVRRIGNHAFFGCRGLKNIHVNGDECVIQDDAFNECFRNDIIMDEVVLEGVKSLGYEAFGEVDCRILELGEGLESIGDHCFYCNEALDNVLIPKSCTFIDENAFIGCDKLTDVCIANPSCTIHENSFDKDYVKAIFGFAGSTAETYAGQKGIQFVPIGNLGTGTIDLSSGTASIQTRDPDSTDYPVQVSLAALVNSNKISYQHEGSIGYMDLDKDGTRDIKYTVDDKNVLQLSVLPNRSVGGTMRFTLSEKAKASLESEPVYIYYETLVFKLAKLANPLTMKGRTASVKYSKLKKKAQTLAVTKVIKFTKDAKDKKTYTLISAKKGKKSFKNKFKINKSTGKVTVKKGLKKGAYKVKVKVKAAGNANYKASAVKTVTFTVKVK